MNDFVGCHQFVDIINYHAELGIFADGAGVEDVLGFVDFGTVEIKSDDFKSVGVNNGADNATDGAAGLDA